MVKKITALLQRQLVRFASPAIAKAMLVDAIEIYHAALAREVENRNEVLDKAEERVFEQEDHVTALRVQTKQEEGVLADLRGSYDTLCDRLTRENDIDNIALDALEAFEVRLAQPRSTESLEPPADTIPVVIDKR